MLGKGRYANFCVLTERLADHHHHKIIYKWNKNIGATLHLQ